LSPWHVATVTRPAAPTVSAKSMAAAPLASTSKPTGARAWSFLRVFSRRRLHAPGFGPVRAGGFRRVLGAVRTIATGQRIGRTIAITAPADALGMGRVDRKFLGHDSTPVTGAERRATVCGQLQWRGCHSLGCLGDVRGEWWLEA